MTRARSLSRLANTNAFTVDASQNVGIGSTQPDVRLDVNGDMNVTGTLTYEDVTNVETAGITTTGGLVVTGFGATIGGITTFFGDLNFGAAGVGGTITTLGHAEFAGVVTATSFSGDGSGLTGVASTDNIITGTAATFASDVYIADSIFHLNDDNTAIRFPTADTFTVETAGSERLRITGIGSVGIGDASPENTLTIKNIGSFEGDANSFYFGSNFTGTGTKFIGSSKHAQRIFINNASANGYLRYDNTGTAGNAGDTITWQERFRVTSDGKVGIASDNPQKTLDIGGDVKIVENSPRLEFHDANAASLSNTTGGFEGYDRNGNRAIYVGAGMGNGGNIIEFGTDNTFRAIIDDSGNIGIGTNNPSFQLDSRETGQATLLVGSYNAGGARLVLDGDSNGDGSGADFCEILADTSGDFIINARNPADDATLIFKTGGGSERLRIASSGQIGLGGANYGTAGQAIVSNGSGSAPTWQDVASGISTQAGTASGIVTSMFLDDATDHKVTATGICTITTTQSGTEGQSHTIRIVNSGIATVGFSTYFLFPSGSAPVLPIADGAVSIISFTVHDSVGAGCTQLLAGASLNFS